MSDPFFTKPSSRKRTSNRTKPTGGGPKRQRVSKEDNDSDIPSSSSDDDDDDNSNTITPSSSEDERKSESAAEKRKRLAQEYLENLRSEIELEQGGAEGFDAKDIDRDLIADRLKENVSEGRGRMFQHFGLKETKPKILRRKLHNEYITGIALNLPYVYTVSKSAIIGKYSYDNLELVIKTRGIKKSSSHTDDILCIAVSDSGKFLVSGGKDHRIVVWNCENLTPLRVFTQHRDAINCLAFRRNSHMLFSASSDRTVKTWGIENLSYQETLFGHQDIVIGVSALSREQCLSVGARDRTARLWKIADETQLVFRSSSKGSNFAEGSVDVVTMIDDYTFICGSDNGSITLWSLTRKKPVYVEATAHGLDDEVSLPCSAEESSSNYLENIEKQPRWITALASLAYGDIFISGSWQGCLKIWKINSDIRGFNCIGQIDGLPGVINSINLSYNDNDNIITIAVGVSKQHRLGQWIKMPGPAKNAIYIIHVPIVLERGAES